MRQPSAWHRYRRQQQRHGDLRRFARKGKSPAMGTYVRRADDTRTHTSKRRLLVQACIPYITRTQCSTHATGYLHVYVLGPLNINTSRHCFRPSLLFLSSSHLHVGGVEVAHAHLAHALPRVDEVSDARLLVRVAHRVHALGHRGSIEA